MQVIETLSPKQTHLLGQKLGEIARPGQIYALTGVSVALLTVYDMCKAIDKRMEITDVHLSEKHGGKSGDFFFGETHD